MTTTTADDQDRPDESMSARRTGRARYQTIDTLRSIAETGMPKVPLRNKRSPHLSVPSYMFPHIERILDQAKPGIEAALARKAEAKTLRRNQDILSWAEENFYIPSTQKPIVLAPHQRAILKLAFTRTETGRFPYTTVIYSTIKKSGKTTISGLVTRWYAETGMPYSSIYCVGNDRDQAKGRAFKEARTSIELTPGFDVARERLPNRWHCQKTQMRNIRNGSEIIATAVDAKGEAGGAPALSVWCVDDQTDALTRAGWKRVIDLTTDDQVAVLDPVTNVMHWEYPRAVNVTPYKGRMKRFKSRRVDFLVTPNHRVFGSFYTHSRYADSTMWGFQEADSAAQYAGGWFKGNAVWDAPDNNQISTHFARFLGYWLAEGHTSNGWVYVSQSRSANPDKYADIHKTIMCMNEDVKCTDSYIRFKDKVLYAPLAALGNQQSRYIPDDIKDLPQNLLRELFDAYMAGDGWRTNSGNYQCETTSQRLADDLMEVGLKLGYHPRLMSSRVRGPGYHRIYRLSFSTKSIAWQRRYNRPSHWSNEQYDGLVGCPSVSTGIFYIRRNGKCCWTGNTELWGYEHDDAIRFWEEMTPISTIPDSLRMVETYAGYEQESKLLLELHDTGKSGRQLTAGELAELTGDPIGAFEEATEPDAPVPIWINEAASLFMYWDSGVEARRMPWQRGDDGERYYREQENSLTPQAFKRLHLNEWGSSEGSFIQGEWWDACYDPTLPPLHPGDKTPVVIGVDAATTGDCFAIVMVSRHPERHDDIAVREIRVWDPKQEGGIVLHEEPENFLRLLARGGCVKRHARGFPERDAEGRITCPECIRCEAARVWDIPPYNVTQIAYDPHQLEGMMQGLRRDAVAWCYAFNQTTPRLLADKNLYDLITHRRITHNGDERLREHILNAGAKMSKEEDSKLRLIKLSQRRKIDLAVATSMAAYSCQYLLL